MYQAQSKKPIALSVLTFNGIPLVLVIDELLLLGSHQLRIILRPSKSRVAETDSITLAEGTVRF